MTSILAVGDAHIGRYPSKVPGSRRDLSVGAVWAAAIEYAIQHRVNAVALTGDVVDNGNAYFEALGPLRQGLMRLAEEDIPVFAVAGNHDFDVLPRLADDLGLDSLRLLGRDGLWETAPLLVDGRVVAWFTGWSFPRRTYLETPLATFERPQKDEPVIGLVHGDLDTARSVYAPLVLADLTTTELSVWLLGHIHKPHHDDSSNTPVLYPGSLQPLDPGETGVHGPWLIKIGVAGHVNVRQVPLATVQYQKLDIDLTNNIAGDIGDVRSLIVNRLREDVRALSGQNSHLKHVSYRLKLSGRTGLHRRLVTRGVSDLDHYTGRSGDVATTIEKVSIVTTPKRNLDTIAKFSDPPGQLARWILQLGSHDGETEPESLISKTIAHVRSKVLDQTRYTPLSSPPLDATKAARLLKEQALLLLDALMAQKEDESG